MKDYHWLLYNIVVSLGPDGLDWISNKLKELYKVKGYNDYTQAVNLWLEKDFQERILGNDKVGFNSYGLRWFKMNPFGYFYWKYRDFQWWLIRLKSLVKRSR